METYNNKPFPAPARSKDFSTDGLDETETLIADTILAAMDLHRGPNFDLSGGGCHAFYTAEEWRGRREAHGTHSALVVVHDGGSLASFFNWDYDDDNAVQVMTTALAKIGYYAESCTCWYTAIYKI